MKSNVIIGVVTSAVFFVVSKRWVSGWGWGETRRDGRGSTNTIDHQILTGALTIYICISVYLFTHRSIPSFIHLHLIHPSPIDPPRFAGHVMAKLPFWPWKLVQNLSHRGIPGEDSTDSSFVSRAGPL